MLEFKVEELYQEIALFEGKEQVGLMEIALKGKMLSQLSIYEPYQKKGYGTQAVQFARERYGVTRLWVRADNDPAIHVYEKCGFVKREPTMFLMEVDE